MGRPLYILAATLGGLALLCFVLSVTNLAQQPGSPGDASLWRTSAMAMLMLCLMATLGGILSNLFEQAERRHEAERREERKRRRP